MRRIITCLIAALCLHISFNAKAQQWVAVPDANFKNALTVGYNLGGCFNATQDSIDANCFAVQATTNLNVASAHINSLEGIEAFGNLQSLYCGDTFLTNLGSIPPSVTSLSIEGMAIATLPSLPSTITKLTVLGNQPTLNSITNLPSSLEFLIIYAQGPFTFPTTWPSSLQTYVLADYWYSTLPLPPAITNLELWDVGINSAGPIFPSSLKKLFLNNYQFNSLDISNTIIDTLYSEFSVNLANLGTLPATMKRIEIYDVPDITTLQPLPNGLEELILSGHSLSALPALPNTLKKLHLADVSGLYFPNPTLTTVPTLPGGLEELGVSGQPITSLPTLPSSLKYLSCGSTGMSSLPALNNGLIFLEAGYFYPPLTSLPSLPSTLQELHVSVNSITSLPTLPSGLKKLSAYQNQLIMLPELPLTIEDLDVSQNPTLSCLPQLPNVMNSLRFDNTNIQCLPNSVYATSVIPALTGFTICDTSNVNGCPIYWNVAGKFYVDSNSNCSIDPSEELFSNLGYSIHRNGNLVASYSYSPLGGFETGGNTNDTFIIKVDTTGLPFVLTCGQADTNQIILTLPDTISRDNHFSLGCKPGFDVAAQSVMTYYGFRPATSTEVNLNAGSFTQFYNVNSCAAPVGAITAVITGPSHVVSGIPTPTYISPAGDSVVWIAVDFFTHNMWDPFKLAMLVDTTAALNSQVCINLSVTPTIGDNNPANNTISNCFNVVNSFDPNDKQVSPPGNLPAYYGDWLTYTIRFQNTGTAEAINIRVEDTLSSYLDMNTFQLLSYSFQPQVQIDGQVVNFKFNNINLPDSNSNEPASHGFVQFRVKPLTWLMPSQPVNNTGYIYFDFNPAIVTNTVSSEVGNPTAVSTVNNSLLDAVVYPNPSKDRWTVQLPADETYFTITVTDMAGRIVSTQNSGGRNVVSISRNGAAAGVYLMKITTASGKAIVKRVVGE